MDDNTRTDSERIAELEKKLADVATVLGAFLGSLRKLKEDQESCRKNIEILQQRELGRHGGRKRPEMN